MKRFSNNIVTMTALASTSLAFAAVANAQAPAADTRSKIDEVQVTARREAENIQSVPVSVVAFSEEVLRQKNITNAEDIQTITPGVFLSGTGGRQNVLYSIRGQSKALSGPSAPAVIAYFAEVPEVSFGSAVSEYDLSSVQVLKGPQGTLFGRNTLGGAILYTPAAPTYEFGGDITGGIGNYQNRELKGAINIPLIDQKLAVRIAGARQLRDGWADDIGIGRDLENVNTAGARISILFDPTEAISNTLIVDYYKAHDHGFESYLRSVSPNDFLPSAFGLGPAFSQQFAAQQARDLYTVDYSHRQFTRNERSGVTDKLSIELSDNYEVVNIFGYRDTSLEYNTNVDGMGYIQSTLAPGLPVKFLLGDLYDNTQQLSDELQLRGLSFDGKLDWLAGVFWLKTEPDGEGGNLVAFADPLLPASSGYNFTTQTSKAVFAHGSYDLSVLLKGLKFNAGVRYTEDDTDSCTGSAPTSGVYDLDDCESGRGLTGAGEVHSESDETTWDIGLDWQINPDLFTYVVTRRGYRAGGANGPTLAAPIDIYQTFDPDTVTDVELGIRSDLHFGDALLRSNISVYRGEYKDVQLPLTGLTGFFTPSPAGGTLLVNAGETTVQGVEFMFTLVPNEHWTLDFGGALMDPDTDKVDVGPVLRPFLSNPDQLPFNYASEKTFTSSMRYEFPLGNNLGDLAFNVSYYYNGEMPISTQMIPSYEIFNGRIDWLNVAQSSVDLSLYGKNLTDKEYLSGGVAAAPGLGIVTSLVGAPRTYGVEARYRF